MTPQEKSAVIWDDSVSTYDWFDLQQISIPKQHFGQRRFVSFHQYESYDVWWENTARMKLKTMNYSDSFADYVVKSFKKFCVENPDTSKTRYCMIDYSSFAKHEQITIHCLLVNGKKPYLLAN